MTRSTVTFRPESPRIPGPVAMGSRGKSGGARVIYYWAVRKDAILLLYAYAKNVAADLTRNQVEQLAKVVKKEFGS